MIGGMLARIEARLEKTGKTRSFPRRRESKRLSPAERLVSWRPVFAGMSAVLVLGLIGSSAAATPVFAEPAPIQSDGDASYSTWSVEGQTVRVRIEVPAAAARKLDAPNAPTPSLARVASAVSAAVSVTTLAGDCEAVDQGEGVGQIYTLALTPGLDRYEIVFACPRADGLTLKNTLLLDRDPRHIGYASIKVGAAKPVLQTFTRDKPSIALAPPGGLRDASPGGFALREAIHVATDLAALGILLGSVFLSRRWLDLAWLGGALATGYVFSIVIALPGLVAIDQGLAITLEGLLIMSLGLGGLMASGPTLGRRLRPATAAVAALAILGPITTALLKSPLAGLATAGIAVFALTSIWSGVASPSRRALVFAPAFLFALLQGQTQAADIGQLQPRADQLAPILMGGDIGAMLAAMTISAAAMAVIWLAGRKLRALRNFAAETSGAALIGFGLFWFVSRLHS